MIIKKINIGKFGKFNDYTIDIKNGLNIIYGCNEAGKTTLQTFIKSMLYGINSQKKSIRENERKRFIPWGENYADGELYIEDDNNVDYVIKRKFGASKREDTLQVINLLTGEEMTGEKWQCPGQVFLGIGEEGFEKTLYIRQLGSTVVRDKEDELMKKLINLKQTGDEDISYHKAVQKISGAKWSLQNNRHTGKIDLLREEIIRLEEEKIKLQALNDKNIEDQIALNSFIEKRDNLKKEINSLEEKRIYINKYKLFKEYEQLKKYKKEIDELLCEIKEIESSLSYGDFVVNGNFIEDVSALNNKRNDLLKKKRIIEQKIEETSSEYEKISDTEKDNILSRLTELKAKGDEIKGISKNLSTKLAGISIAVTAAVLSGVLFNFFYVSYFGLLGLPFIIYLLIKLKNSKRELFGMQVEIKTLEERAKNEKQQIETLREMVLKNHEGNKKDHKEVMEQLENTEDEIRNNFKLIGREDLDFDCFEKDIKFLKEKVNEADNLKNKYNALNKAYQLLISDKSLDAIEKELEGFKLNDFGDEDKFKDLDEDIKKKMKNILAR